MAQQLWLGTDKADITPAFRVPLAGFSTRSELGGFDGIGSPLYARIFWFRHRDPQGRETAALLIAADLIWWGEDRVPIMKQQIHERWGIDPAAILLHGTHSHSSPQTSACFSDYLGIVDPAYVAQLEAAVLAGIARAAGNMEPVTAAIGKGSCGISVNRRMMVDGTASYRANHEGPIDRDLTVVRYRTASGADKGVLVHFACHPVITQQNLVSAEFCGVAMQRIEQALGGSGGGSGVGSGSDAGVGSGNNDGVGSSNGGINNVDSGNGGGKVIAAYLQGFCGDINPVGLDGELIMEGYSSEVERIGNELAEQALHVLAGELRALAPCPLQAVEQSVAAPLQKVPSASELQASIDEPWVTGEWSRKLLESPERLQPDMPLRFVRVDLADGLSLFAANAEVVAEYGLYLKAHAADKGVLPLGYTNGMIGYITTARQIEEGGYESFWSTPYFLLPSPFHPSVEQRVHSALDDLLQVQKD